MAALCRVAATKTKMLTVAGLSKAFGGRQLFDDVSLTLLSGERVGLVGMVIQAKRLGKISSVRVLLEIIESKGGLYLSDAVIAEALRLAYEI